MALFVVIKTVSNPTVHSRRLTTYTDCSIFIQYTVWNMKQPLKRTRPLYLWNNLQCVLWCFKARYGTDMYGITSFLCLVVFQVFFLGYIDMLTYTQTVSGEIHKKLAIIATYRKGNWKRSRKGRKLAFFCCCC